MVTLEHILSRVSPEPNSGCWLWTGCVDKDGYGTTAWGGRVRRVHTVIWECTRQRLFPVGLVPDHLCRTPPCCNPDHLEPVTVLENIRRGRTGQNNATKTHCPSGHAYDEENTDWYLQNGVWRTRRCRACNRRRALAAYYAKKEAA